MDFAVQNARNSTNYPSKHSLLAVLDHAGSRVGVYHDFHASYFSPSLLSVENRLRLPVDLARTHADCAVVGSCCHCLRFRSHDEDLGHDEYQYGCTQLSLDAAHSDLE